MEDNKDSIKSIATNYGIYLGVLLASLTIIAYAVNLELLTNMWYGIFIMIAIIVFGIISVMKSKNFLNGFISFKQSFTAFFITILVGVLISTVVSYILFNFIDLEAAEVIKEKTIEVTINMLEGLGVPNEAIAEAVEEIEASNQFSIGKIIQGLIGQLVLYSVIGLIVAAVMKRTQTEE